MITQTRLPATNWHSSAKRNLFLHVSGPKTGRVPSRLHRLLAPYGAVYVLPGLWYLHTSAGLHRILADLEEVLRADSSRHALLIDATNDEWAGWPADAAAWTELSGYVSSQLDPEHPAATLESP